MSDGPVKLAPANASAGTPPDAPALDDIILGDDDQTVPIPVPQVHKSAAPPAMKENDALAKAIEAGTAPNDRDSTRPQERASNRAPPLDPAKEAARKRQKLTLRIPDDEVSRPQLPATTPMGGIPALGVSPSRPPSAPDFDKTAVMAQPAPQRRKRCKRTASSRLARPATRSSSPRSTSRHAARPSVIAGRRGTSRSTCAGRRQHPRSGLDAVPAERRRPRRSEGSSDDA